MRARMFGRDEDVEKLRGLVTHAVAQRWPRSSLWHVGDVTWQLFQNTTFDPGANIGLWEDNDGTPMGFAWWEPPDFLQMEVHPSLQMNGSVAREIVAWGEERRRSLSIGSDGNRRLIAGVLDGDHERAAFFEEQGFQRAESRSIRFRLSLDSPIPESIPPGRVTVRPVAGEEEFGERVDVHRDAFSTWGPSQVTLEAYRRLRMAPGYEPELDLVSVTQDGIFAAYCICWLDEVNGVGEFEPVGTRPAYRRRGLNQAVLFEGLRRMQTMGMHSAIVGTASFNTAALGLYRSVGFKQVDQEYNYSKLLT